MWNHERTLALIDDIRKNPCLWNPWHVDYKQKHKRNDTFEKLAKKYSTEPEVVEKKIQALKNQFRRERRKALELAKEGNGKVTSFWFGYEPLSFLLPLYRKRNKARRSSQNDTYDKSSDEAEPSSPQSYKDENHTIDTTIEYIPYMRGNPSPQNGYSETTRNWPVEADMKVPVLMNPPMPNYTSTRQEKFRMEPEDDQSETSSKRYRAEENEYQQIAQVWANELQKMDRTQQAYAKKAINEILFEGQMGTLRRNSLIINSPHASPSHFIKSHKNGTRMGNDRKDALV